MDHRGFRNPVLLCFLLLLVRAANAVEQHRSELEERPPRVEIMCICSTDIDRDDGDDTFTFVRCE